MPEGTAAGTRINITESEWEAVSVLAGPFNVESAVCITTTTGHSVPTPNKNHTHVAERC